MNKYNVYDFTFYEGEGVLNPESYIVLLMFFQIIYTLWFIICLFTKQHRNSSLSQINTQRHEKLNEKRFLFLHNVHTP